MSTSYMVDRSDTARINRAGRSRFRQQSEFRLVGASPGTHAAFIPCRRTSSTHDHGQDTVHDHIEIDGVAADLLDTPAVQRLRHVKQLGTVQLVYPPRTTPASSTRSASTTSPAARSASGLGKARRPDRSRGHAPRRGSRPVQPQSGVAHPPPHGKYPTTSTRCSRPARSARCSAITTSTRKIAGLVAEGGTVRRARLGRARR